MTTSILEIRFPPWSFTPCFSRDSSIWDSSQAPRFLAFVLNQSCVVFVLGSTDVF